MGLFPRGRLTRGGGAGDDEAGGLAQPLRHGAGLGGTRRRDPSPHAAAPRMRRAGRAEDTGARRWRPLGGARGGAVVLGVLVTRAIVRGLLAPRRAARAMRCV